VDKINSNLAIRSLLLAAVFGCLVLPARAQAPESGCNVNLHQVRLANPLSHIAKKLVNFEPITIVAIGSSSTAGAGASSPTANYPSRLAVELKRLFPTHSITVLNRSNSSGFFRPIQSPCSIAASAARKSGTCSSASIVPW
jgi:hypothetical protein